MSLDFANLTSIDINNRTIGGKTLGEVHQIIKHILNVSQAKYIKINLNSCETGIMPNHTLYEQIEKAEIKYHQAKSSMISQVIISLPSKQEYNELSSAEYIARKLKTDGYSNIEVSGVNGILLTNGGKTDTVISGDIYSKTITESQRKKLFAELKEAVESKNEQGILNTAYTNLMHIRKIKIKIKI